MCLEEFMLLLLILGSACDGGWSTCGDINVKR